jgi:hypothetical protein
MTELPLNFPLSDTFAPNIICSSQFDMSMLCTEWASVGQEDQYDPRSDFISVFRRVENVFALVRARDSTAKLTAEEYQTLSKDLKGEFLRSLVIKHGKKHVGAYAIYVQQCFRLAALVLVNNVLQDFHGSSVPSSSAPALMEPPFIARLRGKLGIDPSTGGGHLLGMLMLTLGNDCFSGPEKMLYLAQAMKLSLTISSTLWRQTRELLLEHLTSESVLQQSLVGFWDSDAMKREILTMNI